MQPLLQWKSNAFYLFWVYVCSLNNQACNAHAPYRHMWPFRLFKIFPHYLIKDIFLKYYWSYNIYLDFLYQFVRNISHSKKNWVQYDQKVILVFMLRTSHSHQILMKRIFSADFRITLKFQISWKSVHWKPSFSMRTDERTNERTDGRADRHDEANNRFSQLCDRA